MPQRGPGRFPVAGPARLRDPDRDRHGKAEAENKRQMQDVVRESRGSERQNPEAAHHDGIGQRDENLAELTGRERQGERRGEAALAPEAPEDGGGLMHGKVKGTAGAFQAC